MASHDTTPGDGYDTFELGGTLTYEPGVVSQAARYEVDEPTSFRGDQVAYTTLADLPELAASPHWEDRIRAEVLRQRSKIVLPDQFPCIYETPDSPNMSGHKYKTPHAWVVSPDIDMLTELLPTYQELWDGYTSQWGHRSRRTFAVGRLDGLSARGVYVPGTTLEAIIGRTMQNHPDMYRRAPEHIKRMHPQHASWTADRAMRIAAAAL